MVVVPGFYETRKKGGSLKSNTLVTGIQKPAWKEYRVQDNHANTAAEKEVVNFEEEITEVINAPENSIPEMVKVLIMERIIAEIMEIFMEIMVIRLRTRFLRLIEN